MTKVYGDPDPALSYQLTSGTLVGPSTRSPDPLTRAPGEKVAGNPYAIQRGTLSAGGNYGLTSVATTTADITAKPVTGSFTADDRVYDGTTTPRCTEQPWAR